MNDTSNMTMEQQQYQFLDINYPDRHMKNFVYPRSFPSSRSQTIKGENAEHNVYDMLCQIDEPMFTMHSKRFCVLEAGEMDFLICSKDRGIIILEVKSGKKTRDYNQGVTQLEKAAEAVKIKIKKIKICGGHSVSVRYAVVMPNVSRDVDKPTHVEGCYQEDLASKEAFENWLNNILPVLNDRKLDNDKYDKCLGCFLSVILTDHDLNSVYSHLKRLTPEQAEILEGLNEEAYITGPAGSGKTACMVIKASSDELKDQRKLVVVFNKPLRDHLGKNSLLGVQNILVTTFDQLLWNIIDSRMRQAVFNNENNQNRVNTAIKIASDPSFAVNRFDSIFIDEAQDLYGDWEILFDVLHNKGDGHYKWIFYDNNQNVRYSAPPTQNTARQEYHLTKVIRNTKKIFEASKPFYSSKKTVMIAHKIVGPEVLEKRFTDQDIEDINPDVVQFILNSIVTLSTCFGVVRPGDICVLMENEDRAKIVGPKIQQQSNGKVVPFRLDQMVEYMEGKRQWPQRLIGDRGNIGVTVDSVSRFKGLESKVVILVIGAPNMYKVTEKIYVGTTRAVCHLTVLCAQSAIEFLQSTMPNP